MTNHTLQKQLIQSGAILAATSVLFGAFGAHQLKDAINETSLNNFETGVRYQMFHALAILILASLTRRINERTLKTICQIFYIGIGLFCGSLYILATKEIIFGAEIADNLRWIAGLTPVGGLSLIIGWLLLAYKGYKKTESTETTRPHRFRSNNPSKFASASKFASDELKKNS